MIAELIDPAILGFILVGVMLFARFCIWLFRIWKISFLFNDAPIFDGDDRTNSRSCSALCVYGNNDGTSRFNGKVVFSFSNDVS